VVVELPRGGVVKRRDDGTVDFVSPVPCPWNYGSVPDVPGGDGDPLDAVVLGPRLARGSRVRYPVRAVMGFVDAGAEDDKLVVSARPLRAGDRHALTAFFRLYAVAKRALHRVRGERGVTRCTGWR